MKYTTIITTCALMLLSFSSLNISVAQTDAKTEKQPNIILILTDDQGYADVGFMPNASPDIKTPNLDALANDGLVFESAYVVHPFCGPSRAAIMTGRYPHKIGADFNLPVRRSDLGIDANETFISKMLQEAGYFTGAIGKWHLGDAKPYHPNSRGFDEYYGFLGGGHNFFPEYFEKEYAKQKANGVTRVNEYLTPLERNGVQVRETEYITDGLTREAVNFIKQGAEKNKPFFLYLAYNAPHTPLQATKQDLSKFSHIKDKKRRIYAAMVYAVDRGISEVVSALKETNTFDNTVIVFLSDNGGKLSQGAENSPLREGKGSVHEGGHRVPMLMHWPNGIKGGNKFKHPISALDFYPTFAALAGANIPETKTLDGIDFSNSLTTLENVREGKSLFLMRHRKGAHDVSIRRDNFKAVRTVQTREWQLFDLQNDIQEKNDLADKYPNVLRDMVADMAHWAWTNQEPRWFHIHTEGDLWRSENMPRYGETFTIEK